MRSKDRGVLGRTAGLVRLRVEVTTSYDTTDCYPLSGPNAKKSVGRRHSLAAGMPRHLTPCRLWQSSLGRCGFPATLQLERPTIKSLLLARKSRSVLGLRCNMWDRFPASRLAEFAALSLKLKGIPEDRSELILEVDAGCPANRCTPHLFHMMTPALTRVRTRMSSVTPRRRPSSPASSHSSASV